LRAYDQLFVIGLMWKAVELFQQIMYSPERLIHTTERCDMSEVSTTCDFDTKLVKIVHQEDIYSKSRSHYHLAAIISRFGNLSVSVACVDDLPRSGRIFENILVARYWAMNQE
jgi:hypothetical protein